MGMLTQKTARIQILKTHEAEQNHDRVHYNTASELLLSRARLPQLWLLVWSGVMYEQPGVRPAYSSPSMLTLPVANGLGGSLTYYPYARTGAVATGLKLHVQSKRWTGENRGSNEKGDWDLSLSLYEYCALTGTSGMSGIYQLPNKQKGNHHVSITWENNSLLRYAVNKN